MGQTAEATAAFEQAQRLAPADDSVLRAIAAAYAVRGRHDDAERMFQRAIDLRPGFWGNYNAKGSFLMERGRPDEAGALFKKVIQLRPHSGIGYSNLAAVHLDVRGLGRGPAPALRPRSKFSRAGVPTKTWDSFTMRTAALPKRPPPMRRPSAARPSRPTTGTWVTPSDNCTGSPKLTRPIARRSIWPKPTYASTPAMRTIASA